MLGEQFMVGSEVCGAVISVRFQVLALTDGRDHSNSQFTTLFSLNFTSIKFRKKSRAIFREYKICDFEKNVELLECIKFRNIFLFFNR